MSAEGVPRTPGRQNRELCQPVCAPRSTAAPRPPLEKPFGVPSRLRTRAELGYVREQGVRRAGRLCVVCRAESRDGRRRCTMVISRRYSKRAVDRNRARRLLREAYRTLFPRLQPAWMVLIPRHGMRQVKLSPVLAEIERLLDGLGGLRKEGAGV